MFGLSVSVTSKGVHVLELYHVCWVSDVRRGFKAARVMLCWLKAYRISSFAAGKPFTFLLLLQRELRINNDSLSMTNLCRGAVSPSLYEKENGFF